MTKKGDKFNRKDLVKAAFSNPIYPAKQLLRIRIATMNKTSDL